MSYVWLNQEFVDEASASISLRDTGLLHGAGVFTTMRSFGGRVFRLSQHLARLRKSCEALSIPLQYNELVLTDAVAELLARNELREARLRLTVTRGYAKQTVAGVPTLEPTAFLSAVPLEPYPQEFYQRGITAAVLDEQKLNPYDLVAGHKTLNYVSRLAALRDATRRGAGEALWFNVHNFLQSGSISNVFLVKDNALITPPTQDQLRDPQVREQTPYARSNVLPGVIRQAVTEIARASGIDVRTEAIDIHRLLDADEVFVTNSIMLMMPVARIERKAIGNERPGDATVKLSEALAELIERETTTADA